MWQEVWKLSYVAGSLETFLCNRTSGNFLMLQEVWKLSSQQFFMLVIHESLYKDLKVIHYE